MFTHIMRCDTHAHTHSRKSYQKQNLLFWGNNFLVYTPPDQQQLLTHTERTLYQTVFFLILEVLIAVIENQ